MPPRQNLLELQAALKDVSDDLTRVEAELASTKRALDLANAQIVAQRTEMQATIDAQAKENDFLHGEVISLVTERSALQATKIAQAKTIAEQAEALTALQASQAAEIAKLKQEIERLKVLVGVSNPPPGVPAVVATGISPSTFTIDETDGNEVVLLTAIQGGNPRVFSAPVLSGADAALFSAAMASDTMVAVTLLASHVPATLNLALSVTNAAGASTPAAITGTVVSVPDDISLSASTVVANSPIGTSIGTLTTHDGVAPYTYEITAGGSKFALEDDELVTAALLLAGSENVTVRTTDSRGTTFSEAFSVTVSTPAEAPANTWVQTNRSGVTQTNYPLRVAKAGPFTFVQFPQGALLQGPVLNINGVAVNTQYHATKRYAGDNSVEEALIFAIIPSWNHNEAKTYTFTDGPTMAGSTPAFPNLTISAELAKAGFPNQSAAMQTMKNAGHFEDYVPGLVVVEGPLATMKIFRDKSAARTYDLGFTPGRILRPTFVVTHLHTINKTWLRFVAQISRRGSVENESYDSLTLNFGGVTQVTAPFAAYYGTWLTKQGWIGTAPTDLIDTDCDLETLNALGITCYEPAFAAQVSDEPYKAARYAEYTNAPKGFYQKLNLTQSLAGSWEGQTDHGACIDPLLNHDYRGYIRMFEQADHYHFRTYQTETDPTKMINPTGNVPAMGGFVSANSLPGTRLLSMTTAYTAVPTSTTFTYEVAHDPPVHWIPYAITGDWYYRECLQNRAATEMMKDASASGAPTSTWAPRRHSPDIIHGFSAQKRSDAWHQNQVQRAAKSAPHGTAALEYFTKAVNDLNATHCGLDNIPIASLTSTPGYAYGQAVRALNIAAMSNIGWHGIVGADGAVPSTDPTAGGRQIRQQNYFPQVYRIGLDYRFDCEDLLDYYARPVNDGLTQAFAGQFEGVSVSDAPKSLSAAYQLCSHIGGVPIPSIAGCFNALTLAERQSRAGQFNGGLGRYAVGTLYAVRCSKPAGHANVTWVDANILNNAAWQDNLRGDITGRPMTTRN